MSKTIYDFDLRITIVAEGQGWRLGGLRVKKIIRFGMEQLTEEIRRLCGVYRDCCVEVERRDEGRKVREEVGGGCLELKGRLKIGKPEVLLALMDAYEVTRDEGMLQEVLDIVSEGMDRLPVSPEGVKLLSYCYYYVEEEECGRRAKEMLEELRRRENGRVVEEAGRVYREMVEEEGGRINN